MVSDGLQVAESYAFNAIDSLENLVEAVDPSPLPHATQTLTYNFIWFLCQ